MTGATAKQRIDYRRGAHDRAANDFYIEPRWAVDALLDAERFVGGVWDPACGTGTIPSACLERQIRAWGSDIVDRGAGEVRDFLHPEAEFANVHNIISNPPFKVADRFIERALEVADHKVAMLLRLAFLEGQKRAALYRRTPLARVHVFAGRVSMPPGDMLLAGEVEARGGSVAFAWFVWDKDWQGPATLNWLDRPHGARG